MPVKVESTLQSLPLLGHVELGEGMLVPQKALMRADPENASVGTNKFPILRNESSVARPCDNGDPVRGANTTGDRIALRKSSKQSWKNRDKVGSASPNTSQ